MHDAFSSGSSAPLVGRDVELRALGEALAHAVAGRGQVVLLSGEPGIGKTRMSNEIADQARRFGIQILSSRCFEWSGAPAYWPWRQAIGAFLDTYGTAGVVTNAGETLAPLATIIPQIEKAIRDMPTPTNLNQEYERFQVFEAAATLVRQLARQEPLLLILDDLHWADPTSLLLLEFVTPAIQDSKVLIIGTHRDTEVARGEALSRTLANLIREPNVDRIFLKRLTRAAVLEFVALTAGEPVTDNVAGLLYEKCDGNPLFMNEIVHMLATDYGALWATDSSAQVIRLPSSIRDTVLQRVDRLPKECVRILSVASAIGRDFSLSLLTPAAELEADAILEALEPAVRARVIEPAAHPGNYRFSHVLVQGTIYDEISGAERVRLHWRIAEALERTDATLSGNVAEVAYHYYQALPVDDAEKALHYAIRAGDQAVQQMAWESAIEYYERARSLLDIGGPSDGETRCDVLLSLGSTQWLSGHTNSSLSTYHAALEVARRLGSPERQARAVLGIAGSDVIGIALRDEQPIDLIEDALTALGPGDSALRVRLLSQLAYLHVEDSDHVQQRYEYGEEAVAIARRLGDVAALLQALDAAWYAFQGPDMARERLVIASEQLRVAEQTGDRYMVMMAHAGIANDALVMGDIVAFADHVAEYERLAQELRLPVHLLGSAHMRAILSTIQGSVEEARRIVDQIPPEHVEALPNGAGPRMLNLLRLVIYREQERLTEIIDQIEDLPTGVTVGGELHCQIEWALAHLELENPQPARQLFEWLASDSFANLARDEYWIPTLMRAADIAIAFNDPDRAETLYNLLIDYPDQNVTAGLQWVCYGSVSHWLGLLATALERYDAAEQHFEQALTMHERMGTGLFSTQTRVAYAQMLAKRGQANDRERALDLVNQALATAEELGLIRLARLATEILDSVSRSPAPSDHALSPRELEVLRLLVDGLTDREIGGELSISHRTVMRHVTHILNKLGVNSRTAAATIAVRRGIV